MDSKFAQKDESLDHDYGDTISDKFIKIYRVSHMYLDDGCGIQISQATATNFYLLFKHTYLQTFLKIWWPWLQFFLCQWPYYAIVL